MEPPAVLVASLQIDREGPLQLRVLAEDRFVTRTRVEPDVEDVALTLELGAVALRAPKVVWEKLGEVTFVPGVGAVGAANSVVGMRLANYERYQTPRQKRLT